MWVDHLGMCLTFHFIDPHSEKLLDINNGTIIYSAALAPWRWIHLEMLNEYKAPVLP